MSKSKRYIELIKALTILRFHLLPKTFEPTGSYEPEDLTRALAYRIMAHAEMEAYIEDRALELALFATNSCKSKNKISKTMVSLLAFSGKLMEEPPNAIMPPKNQAKNWDEKIKLEKRIDLAYNAFYNAKENNHGVREYNLLRLLLPIGIDVDMLDQLWVSAMDDFGKSRGEVAHNSSTKSTQQVIDPSIEFNRIKNLIKGGINKLDDMYEQLFAEMTP